MMPAGGTVKCSKQLSELHHHILVWRHNGATWHNTVAPIFYEASQRSQWRPHSSFIFAIKMQNLSKFPSLLQLQCNLHLNMKCCVCSPVYKKRKRKHKPEPETYLSGMLGALSWGEFRGLPSNKFLCEKMQTLWWRQHLHPCSIATARILIENFSRKTDSEVNWYTSSQKKFTNCSKVWASPVRRLQGVRKTFLWQDDRNLQD